MISDSLNQTFKLFLGDRSTPCMIKLLHSMSHLCICFIAVGVFIPISIIHFIGDESDNRGDICPDIDELTRRCGSRECIRRPNDDERCLQCIMDCSG